MRITKNKSEYYKRRMAKLFEEVPDSKYVRNRYRTLRYLALEKHLFMEQVPKDKMIEFLREIVYLDRLLRLNNEYLEKSTKKILSDQFVQQELYAKRSL